MAATASQSNLAGLPRRLVQDGIVSEDQLQEAAESAKKERLPLIAYLVNEEIANARSIAVAASHEFGVPLLDLDAVEIDLEVVRAVDQNLITKHRVLPLVKRGQRIFLGIADPTNLQAIDDIRFQTSLRIDPVVVEQDKLEERITKAIEAVDTTMADLGEDDFDLEKLNVGVQEDEGEDIHKDDVEDAPVVRFVNKILLDAIKRGASDVHFEPYEKFFRVRTRLDGVLSEVAQPPVVLANKVCARLKVMSRMDIAERRVPQDGRIKMRLSRNRAIDFRVNTCPTLFGEKIVLRILDPSSAKLGIDALGYEDAQKALYLKHLNKPYGMILVTGPTGSGKTVSLYTGLNILNTIDRNISTAEDPAEINLPGINQVNVNPKVGLTFASSLKAFLRQDPDVIMVGEIRDLETAVSLIIAQRLARRLCDNCKEAQEIPKEALKKEGFVDAEIEKGVTVFAAKGCKQCNEGYKGRLGIFQVMEVSEAMGRIIMEGGNAMQIADQAAKEGVIDLRRAGLNKVKEGVTSLVEVNRVTIE
jgi:type IV pilus assembly protein PilB